MKKHFFVMQKCRRNLCIQLVLEVYRFIPNTGNYFSYDMIFSYDNDCGIAVKVLPVSTQRIQRLDII